VKREIILTGDGSATISIPELNECYHSRHGAIREAYHVFIERGLHLFPDDVSILEIGFGTGLNAFITFLESEKYQRKITYTGVEAYPVSAEEVSHLNYVDQLEAGQFASVFEQLHLREWDSELQLSEKFKIRKLQQKFEDLQFEQHFDLIYFDAFGFAVQPELWSAEIFASMYRALKPEGILVTYAARSIIKRNMQLAGFVVEKMDGPPGKREMMRGLKNNTSNL